MDFHPQPQAGDAQAVGLPGPRARHAANGLTVLRCHRPGQQVVAVEVNLDAPLDAEPEGLDGVATIMARALSEGTDKHSAEEFAAELERCGATLDAHADHPGVRVSLEVPVSRLPKALGLLADALRAPAFPDSEVERLVRNRLDEIPHELANPARRAAKELSKELFPADSADVPPAPGHRGDGRGDRLRGRTRLLRGARPPRHGHRRGRRRPHRHRPGRRCSATPWAPGPARTAEPRPVPPVTADDTGRVVIVDRPGAVQTQLLIGRDRRRPARPRVARAGARHVLPGRHPHLPPGPGAARGEGLHLRRARLRPGAALRRRTARAPRCSPSAARWTPRITGPALDDLWKVLRTLAAEGLTDAERDVAVQNLVGVAPLKYETAAAVAGTLADQVEQHLPDDYQAQLYAQLAETGTVEATAAAVSAFPVDRLVTVLVGDAAQIEEPVAGPGHRRGEGRHRLSADRRSRQRPATEGPRRRDESARALLYVRIDGEVACLPCGMRYKTPCPFGD